MLSEVVTCNCVRNPGGHRESNQRPSEEGVSFYLVLRPLDWFVWVHVESFLHRVASPFHSFVTYFHTGLTLCPWLQVLSHVSTCVRDIHAANYVHGDVKPAHIVHLRQENRWKLTDFDRAAVFGAAVPLDFTLTYAAPELVAASDNGQDMVAAHPAVDCWAMGVVAFELLTGQQALDSTGDREAV